MVKRAKTNARRQEKSTSSKAAKSNVAPAAEVDLSNDSEHSAALLQAFKQYLAQQKVVNTSEVNLKDAILAMSPDLNTSIPGWRDLAENQMNTRNKLFRQVYQKLANYVKRSKPTVESAPVQSSQRAQSEAPASESPLGTVSESSVEPNSAGLYGSESAESEQLDQDPASESAAKEGEQAVQPPNRDGAPLEAYDEDVFWYHLEHYDNPINKAKRKCHKYRKLHRYWKLQLRKARNDVYMHICEEDSEFVKNKD